MSGIIKAQSTPAERSPVGAVVFNYDDVAGKANAYLAQVKAEAAQLLAAANEEAKKIRQQAQQQGSKAAVDAAEKSLNSRVEAQVRQQMQTALPAVEQMVQAITAARLEWLEQWEQNAVALAVAIAEKIIRRELAARPEITLALVREALELAAGSQQLKVHLHPQDHTAFGAQVAELARHIAQLAPTDIVADPAVSAGGCVVYAEFGSIDQRIESQLARISEELF